MKDFFTYYKDINHMNMPFETFSSFHMLFLLCSITYIFILYRHYQQLDENRRRRFQTGMAVYFLIEEAFYTLWLLYFCHDKVWLQILPLELCSCCVYINALAVFTQKDTLRSFSGIIGLAAGAIAMLYPANISSLYPVLSYRTINFYILHASFILFACIQLKDLKLLQRRYVQTNFLMLIILFTIAFTVNMVYKTQYMFVGTPPSISFIAQIYHVTGVVFFLPIVLLIIGILQYVVVILLRKICLRKTCMTLT